MRAAARLFFSFVLVLSTTLFILFYSIPSTVPRGGRPWESHDPYAPMPPASDLRGIVNKDSPRVVPEDNLLAFGISPRPEDYDPQQYLNQRPSFNSTLYKLLKGYLDQVEELDEECTATETLKSHMLDRHGRKYPESLDDNWDRFYAEINNCDLYPKDSKIVDKLLNDLSTQPIAHAAIMSGGTQAKLTLTFENGKRAVFKPLRWGLNYETNPNHFYFSDFERANSEIAAFHLDRLLGLRRAVPTAGRVLDLTQIKEKADKSLAKTFFISPEYAICGKPNHVRGSVQALLPDKDEYLPRDRVRSPWRRTYSKRNQIATWQEDNTYCEWHVQNHIPYGSDPRRLLDVVDLYTFDFLMGNLDRHHYEVVDLFEEQAYPVHLDNGRGFGKPFLDESDIAAPLYQCCVIRRSTLDTLMSFYKGPRYLSVAMRESLAKDPLSPVLAAKHLPALDRRLEKVLTMVLDCVRKNDENFEEVIRNTYSYPDPLPEEREKSNE